jgi:hypothetical protein
VGLEKVVIQMGIVHLAGLGTSPGAVTAALAYVKRNPQPGAGEMVEELIVFTSPEIRNGKLAAEEYTWNEYGKTHPRKGWNRPRHQPNVLKVVQEFLQLEEVLPPRGKMYVWEVDTNDFDSCFEAVAKVVVAKGDPMGTGKHLWANLTGGTNVLNAAILEAAIFSGFIARIYYTFVGGNYRHYLQPAAEGRPDCFDFRDVTFFKVVFDERYDELLKVLDDIGNPWMEDRDLLSHFKQRVQLDSEFNIQGLRTQYLNHMHGRELEREGSCNRLSAWGKKVLELIEDDVYKALIRREETPPAELVQKCQEELEQKLCWEVR